MKKPTLGEVQDYCLSRRNGINPQSFLDYNDSVGWMVGKNKPMKNWQAAIRTWERNQRSKPVTQGRVIDKMQDRSWAE